MLINCVNNRRAGAPRPWRRRQRGFAVATLVATHRNGPRSAINDERIGGGGSGLVSQHNNQLMEATQTIYPLGKEEEEKGKG